jgi:hypothetical protein
MSDHVGPISGALKVPILLGGSGGHHAGPQTPAAVREYRLARRELTARERLAVTTFTPSPR